MARVRELNRGKLSFEADSVPDVFREIKKQNWHPQQSESSNSRGDGSFHSFKDLATANDVFLNHPEQIRQFSQNDDRLQNYESPGNEVFFDVTGDFLDIDKYLEGEPEMFGNSVMGNPKSIFCTINILNSAVYYTTPEYMLAKQKRILRLVDWLESQSIRCQIVMTEDSSVSYTSIVVKEFADPFDLNQLAVAMHPDFFRRTMFLIMEQSKTWSYGYGSSMEYDARMQAYKPAPEDGLYIYVGGYIPFGGSQNGTKGVKMLDEAFEKIEDSIVDMINEGKTWTDEPLIVKGSKNEW